MAVKTPNTQEEQDAAYNPGELHAREQFDGYASAGVDQAEAFANDPANATKEKEEDPDTLNYTGGGESSSGKQPTTFWGQAKKKGPLGLILAIFGFGGLGLSFFSGPALLIVNVKEVLTNYNSSASRAAPNRFQQRMAYLFGGSEGACQSNPSSIKCKRGSMKEKNVQKYRDAGFDFPGEKKVGDRTIISKITFPDGTTVNNAAQFRSHIRNNPQAASDFNRILNPKTLVFNGGRFSSKVLAKWGLNKGKLSVTGSDDEERRKSINKSTGADSEDTDEKRRTKFESKFGGKIKGAAKVAGVGPAKLAGATCALYSMSRAVIASVKLYNAARFAAFAMIFLKAADQIKTEGDIDPETVALLGGVLTSYYTAGPKKGLTATDSQGYKIAAHGGERGLASFSEKFLLGGNSKLLAVEDMQDWIRDMAPGGQSTIKGMCKGATNPVVGTAIAGGICAAAAAGVGGTGFIAGTVVPVIGNAIGGIGGAVVGGVTCVAAMVGIGLASGAIIGKIFEHLLPKVVEYLADSPIDINKIKGPDAGNALAAGAGVILETANMSRGLQPGTKAGVENFNASTFNSEKEYETIARYEARNEPFNIMNEYSFLGSLVRKSGIIGSNFTSFSSSTGAASSILQSSVSLIPKASATASQKLNITQEDLSHCPDKYLSDIGVDCDVGGGIQYTMKTTISVKDNLDFMIGTHAEEDGTPVSEDYKNWIKYCTEERENPVGMDGGPIEDETAWTTGEACVSGSSEEINQTTRDHFSTFYYDNAAQEDEEYEPQTSAPVGAGSNLRVATYNILGKSHTNPGPGQTKDSDAGDWNDRIVKVVENIQSNSIDVIGLQEAEDDQINYLKSHLSGYELSTKGKQGDSILWNASKFSKTGEGTWESKYFDGRDADNEADTVNEPWVKLKDNSTGQEFFFMNVHDPINNPGTNAQVRFENAQKHLAKINELNTQAPVILTGDFNNGYRKDDGSGMPSDDKTAYCVLSNGGMTDAIDAFKDQEFKCSGDPRPDKGSDIDSNIDHIYVSEGLDVTKYSDINKPQSGSDHVAVVADVVIPGEEDGGSTVSGDLAWPLKKQFFDSDRADWLGPHTTATGTAWGVSWGEVGVSSKGTQIATDIGNPPDGSPVYAMLGGKVVSTDLCGDKDGIAIKSSVNGKDLFIAYMHGTNKKYNVGDTVEAGKQIMSLGAIGCSVSGGHVHIGIAYDGKYVCPQDVFLAMDKGDPVDWANLASKAEAPCGRV